MYIGSGSNPVPNPAGVDLRDYRLDIEIGGNVHTYHLNEPWFEPDDASGDEHEWEWMNVPAGLIPLTEEVTIRIYRPLTQDNYVATVEPDDEIGDVYTLESNRKGGWEHPHAPTIRTYDEEDVDAGHDFKVVALEEAEPKSATAIFDSSAVMEWQASVTVDPTHTGSLILGLPAGSGTNPGRWTLNISPITTPVELWEQAATHLRMRFSSDGAAYGNWVEYPIEIDTSVGNALSYRTTQTNLTTPGRWVGRTTGYLEWNVRLADGTLTYPDDATVTQKAAELDTLKSKLGVPTEYVKTVVRSGAGATETITFTLQDDSTISFTRGDTTSTPGMGATLEQVYTALALIPQFTYTNGVFSFSLQSQDVQPGHLDVRGNRAEAFRTAIGAAAAADVVTRTAILALFSTWAQATNTDRIPADKQRRAMSATQYAALTSGQRGGIINIV